MQTMQNMQNIVQRFPNRQRGGLVLGVILGVLMGLGIAFFVFSYANKTPAPQINKAQTRSPSQDEAEAEKNKNWDPNSPLYGKNPMKPLQPASGAESAASGVPSSSKSSNSEQQSTASNEPNAMRIPSATPIPKPEITQIEHKSTTPDPVGDLIKSKSKSAAAPVDTFSYFVQLGAFRSQDEAENQRAKLALSGVQTKITERDNSGRPVYRVRMGPYTSKEEAERMKDKMASMGMETSLVRVER